MQVQTLVFEMNEGFRPFKHRLQSLHRTTRQRPTAVLQSLQCQQKMYHVVTDIMPQQAQQAISGAE